MGWASESTLMDNVIEILKNNISEDKRKDIYMKMIPAFQNMDWDTETECMDYDPAFDEAIKELHPEWFIEDED